MRQNGMFETSVEEIRLKLKHGKSQRPNFAVEPHSRKATREVR